MDDAKDESLPMPPDAQSPARSKSDQASSPGSVKETLEAILVAFILAFIFRAFIVEAFVIPTGSMAPTLMGAHMRFHCPDCGYAFDVNYSGPPSDSDDIVIPSTAGKLGMPIYCPNCGFQIDSSQTDDPPVYYGDRILVLKYLYLFQQPSRWDVVVFKSPVRPTVYNYGQNYIKRLIGKPGEAVTILDGDVYIRPPDAKNPTDFIVQTKPKHVQDALWRLVYDNDHRPQQNLDRGSVPQWRLPWTVADGSGWNLNDNTRGRVFSFDNTAGASTLAFQPNANSTSHTLSDYLVYDTGTAINYKYPSDGYPNDRETPVSDLDLRLTYQRFAGEGPLSLALTKRGETFTAVLTPGGITLYHDTADKRIQIGPAYPLPPSSRPVRVELSNVDYQVILRIDDQIARQTTPADYAPDLNALLHEFHARIKPPAPRVQIIADHQTSQLSHISLWRDVYYYNYGNGVRWATPDDFPNRAQVLGPDEYFVMGDNSLVSYDARCWTEPIDLPGENLQADAGRVPGRFLLGKAFFVYWPAGYRPTTNLPAFIPNFGDMRLIH